MALVVALAAGNAGAQTDAEPARAVLQPAPDVQVTYERLGPAHAVNPPGRFEGSVTTPAGTVRTTLHAEPDGESVLRRGDTTLQLPEPVVGGQLELRNLENGATAAVWRAPLGAGLTAEAIGERMPGGSRQALRLEQDLGDGDSVRALISNSSAAAAQGWGWELELAQESGRSSWSLALEAADRSYLSSSGDPKARAGVRLSARMRVLPNTSLEARYTRRVQWQAEDSVSHVVLGSRYQLPHRLSLLTGVEGSAEAGYKASVTLSMPLGPR